MKTVVSSVAFQGPDGTIAANGRLLLSLSQNAMITAGGGQVYSNIPIVIDLDANGLIPANTQLWANDQLTPSGTTYLANLQDKYGTRLDTLGTWSIAGASPIDLSLMVPTSSAISFPNPVLLSPAGTQTIVQPTGTSLNVNRFENIRFADQFASLSAAISDLPAGGGIVYLPDGYVETQAGAFHFTKSKVSVIALGSATITNTAGWFIDAGVNHVAIEGNQPWGMDTNGTNTGFSLAGYTGAGTAFQIGAAAASTFFISLKNLHIDLTVAAASAIGIKLLRTQFVNIDNPAILLGANLQTGIDSDGTGDFCGFVKINNPYITSGVGGTNATGIRSGPLSNAFEVSGGDITLIQAGTSRGLVADGGEMWLDYPNVNTAITACVTLKNGTNNGRMCGHLRVDSGVTNGANFGANTLASRIWCDNATSVLPVVDNGGASSFNSFITPDALQINSNHWAIDGPVSGQFVIKDIVNSLTPMAINAGGNVFIGNGTGNNQLLVDTGSRLVIGGTSAPAGAATYYILWGDSGAGRLKMNNNNTGATNVVGASDITATLKTGTGAGNYTSASTTYVRVDSTNLAYTVTIPTGWKLICHASGTALTITGIVQFGIALADGSADNTGILVETRPLANSATIGIDFALDYVINGDGASHTVNLQYLTTNGADSVLIANATSTFKPTMTFLLTPSN